jgi:aryl-alcohol dehydrogenase-like predicted oxidoreductase
MTTRIAFGSMALTDVYNPNPDLSEAEPALRTAVEFGVQIVHTAEHYGRGGALELIRRLPDGCRKSLTICAKIEAAEDRFIRGPEGINSTAGARGRDCIDMVQLVAWSPWSADATRNIDDVLDDLQPGRWLHEAVNKLRESGRVRQVGVEVTEHHHVEWAAAMTDLDFVVGDYSIMRQVSPARMIPQRIARSEMMLLATRPLAGGWLTARYRMREDYPAGDRRPDWYAPGEQMRVRVAEVFRKHRLSWIEGSLRFLHHHEFPQMIAVGMRTPNQVRQVLDGSYTRPLSEEIYKELAALFEQPVVLDVS